MPFEEFLQVFRQIAGRFFAQFLHALDPPVMPSLSDTGMRGKHPLAVAVPESIADASIQIMQKRMNILPGCGAESRTGAAEEPELVAVLIHPVGQIMVAEQDDDVQSPAATGFDPMMKQLERLGLILGGYPPLVEQIAQDHNRVDGVFVDYDIDSWADHGRFVVNVAAE